MTAVRFLKPAREADDRQLADIDPLSFPEPPILPGYAASAHLCSTAWPRTEVADLLDAGLRSDKSDFSEADYTQAREAARRGEAKKVEFPFWDLTDSLGEGVASSTRASKQGPRAQTLARYTSLRKNSGPVLLCVHATGSHKEAWLPMIRDLLNRGASFSEIWLLDLLSHGQAEVVNSKLRSSEETHGLGSADRLLDHNDAARDIIQFLEHFLPQADDPEVPARLPFHPNPARTRPVLGVGSSVGATALLAAAYHHPELFSGLVLSEPILCPAQALPMARKVRLGAFALRKTDSWPSQSEAEAAIRRDPALAKWTPEAVDLYLSHALYHAGPDEVRLICDKVVEALSLNCCIPAVQMAEKLHLFPQTVPVLYLSSTKPLMLPLPLVEKMVKRIRDARLVVIDGGHHLPQEKPQDVASAVHEFLREELLRPDSRL